MPEHAVPLAANVRCKMLLTVLLDGPKSTVDLQRLLPLVHVARQVWELRHWYGYRVATGRLPNGVARYTLLPSPGATPFGPANVERKGEAVAARGLFE